MLCNLLSPVPSSKLYELHCPLILNLCPNQIGKSISEQLLNLINMLLLNYTFIAKGYAAHNPINNKSQCPVLFEIPSRYLRYILFIFLQGQLQFFTISTNPIRSLYPLYKSSVM